jgi:hypothetical protein
MPVTDIDDTGDIAVTPRLALRHHQCPRADSTYLLPKNRCHQCPTAGITP